MSRGHEMGMSMMKRGRPALQRQRIRARADEMRSLGQRVNKSRIARELHVPLRTVFRVLQKNSALRFLSYPQG
jgi:hypothetical protein